MNQPDAGVERAASRPRLIKTIILATVAIVIAGGFLVVHSRDSLDRNSPHFVAAKSALDRPATFEDLIDESAKVEMRPVDDGLFQVIGSDGSSITTPSSLSDGATVVASDETVLVRPLGADVTGAVAANGVASYRQAAPDTDIYLQSLSSATLRAFYIVGSKKAPESFDTEFTLPEGARLEKLGAGVVARDANGKELLAIPTPWALDADGDPVDSHYAISGDVISLRVDHRDDNVRYPVVADPVALLAPVAAWAAKQIVQGAAKWAIGKAVGWAGREITGDPCFSIDYVARCAVEAPGNGSAGGSQLRVGDNNGGVQGGTLNPQGGNVNPQNPGGGPVSDPSRSGAGTISLSRGGAAPRGSWYAISLRGFAAGAQVTVTCRDSADPGGFISKTLTTDGSGSAGDSTLCYSGDGPDHWVTGGGVESNHVSWSSSSTPTGPPAGAPSTISLSRGGGAPHGSWYSISLRGFAPGAQITVTCRDSADPGGFYNQTFTIDGSGAAGDSTLCYSGDGPDHWVTGGGVESNHVPW